MSACVEGGGDFWSRLPENSSFPKGSRIVGAGRRKIAERSTELEETSARASLGCAVCVLYVEMQFQVHGWRDPVLRT